MGKNRPLINLSLICIGLFNFTTNAKTATATIKTRTAKLHTKKSTHRAKPTSLAEAQERLFGYLGIDKHVKHGSTHTKANFKPQEFFDHLGMGWNDFLKMNAFSVFVKNMEKTLPLNGIVKKELDKLLNPSVKILNHDIKPLWAQLAGPAHITIETSSATGGPMLHIQLKAKDATGNSMFAQQGTIDINMYIELPATFPFIGVIFSLKIAEDVKLKFADIDPRYKIFDAVIDIKGEAILMFSTWLKRWGTIAGPEETGGTSKDYTARGPDGFLTTKEGLTLTSNMQYKGFLKETSVKFKQRVIEQLRLNVPFGPSADITTAWRMRPAISLLGKPLEDKLKWKLGVSSITRRISLSEKVRGGIVSTDLLIQNRLGLKVNPPGIKVPYDAIGTRSVILVMAEEVIPIGGQTLSLTIAQPQAKRSWRPFDGKGPIALHNLAFQVDFLEAWIPIALGIGGNIGYKSKEIALYGKLGLNFKDWKWSQPFETILIAEIPKEFRLYPYRLLLGAILGYSEAFSDNIMSNNPLGHLYVDNANLYISPSIGQIGRAFFKPGFILQGDLHILNNTLKTKFGIDSSGFAAYTKIQKPLVIATIGNSELQMTDTQNDQRGPLLDIQLQAKNGISKVISHAILSGKLSFGTSFVMSGLLELTKSGFMMKDKAHVAGLTSQVALTIPFSGRGEITLEADATQSLAPQFKQYIKSLIDNTVKDIQSTCEKLKISSNCAQPFCIKHKISCSNLCNATCPIFAPFPLNKSCGTTCETICTKAEPAVDTTIQTWLCGAPERCKKWEKAAYKKVCDATKTGCKRWNKKVTETCKTPAWVKTLQRTEINKAHFRGTLNSISGGTIDNLTIELLVGNKPKTITIAQFNPQNVPQLFESIIHELT